MRLFYLFSGKWKMSVFLTLAAMWTFFVCTLCTCLLYKKCLTNLRVLGTSTASAQFLAGLPLSASMKWDCESWKIDRKALGLTTPSWFRWDALFVMSNFCILLFFNSYLRIYLGSPYSRIHTAARSGRGICSLELRGCPRYSSATLGRRSTPYRAPCSWRVRSPWRGEAAIYRGPWSSNGTHGWRKQSRLTSRVLALNYVRRKMFYGLLRLIRLWIEIHALFMTYNKA